MQHDPYEENQQPRCYLEYLSILVIRPDTPGRHSSHFQRHQILRYGLYKLPLYLINFNEMFKILV